MGHIKFATAVGKYCQEVKIFVRGKRMPTIVVNGEHTAEFEADVTSGSLRIRYEIAKDNNTKYAITYSCTEDDVERKDPSKNSPIRGRIESGNYTEETINVILSSRLARITTRTRS